MRVIQFCRLTVVWILAFLALSAVFLRCTSTAPEDQFKIVADSAWLDLDRLIIFRDISSGNADTLFDGKLNSFDELSALPVGGYTGGKVRFTIQGFTNGQLVFNQMRDFDGATNGTLVITLVDFSTPPISVMISKDTVNVNLGAQSEILSASVLPTKAQPSLTWKTLGGVGFLVFQNGDSGTSVKFFGNSVGIGKVIAQSKKDSNIADTSIIVVADTTLNVTVQMSPDSLRLNENGTKDTLQVSVLPQKTKLYFSSRDSSIVTVDSAGIVTPHKAGKTIIVVKTITGSSDSSVVEVLPVIIPPSVALLPDSIQLKENGQVYQMLTNVVPASDALFFLSLDTSVATIDSIGRVRSRKLGKTVVIVKSESDMSDTSVVEVIPEVVPLKSVRISPDSIRMKEGGKQDTLQISRSIDLPTAKVTFQTRDSSIVRVDSLGRFRTGKPGKTWIIATIAGGDPDSSLIDVYANVGPVIESFTANGNSNATISIRDTVVFNLIAHDGDGIIKTLIWRLNKDTAVQIRDTVDKVMAQRSRPQAFSDTGTYRIRVSVLDDNGSTANDSLVVRVVLDPPVVYAGQDTAAKMGESLVFTGAATQTYGNIVMWKWDYDGNGSWDDSSATSPLFSHAFFKEARYTATLYARDDDGNSATDFRLIDITNSPLVLFGLSPRDTVISIKDSVPFQAKAASLDGQVRLISWDFDGDGAQDDTLSVNESSLTFRGGHRFDLAGVYKLALKATDNSGRTIKDSATITVKQDLPKANAGKDTLVFTDTKVTLHALGMDSLGTIVKKEWSIAGANFVTVSQADTTFTAPNSVSTLNCILRVTDDDGFSALDTVKVTVALHRETHLDSLRISDGTLSPEFHADSLLYRDTVGLSVTSIKVTATLRDGTANMKLKGKVLNSGIPSDTLMLSMGINTFPIAVVAADTAYKKTYTLSVVKVDDVPPSPPIVTVQDTLAPAKPFRPVWTWVSGGGGGAGYRYKLNDSIMTTGSIGTTLTTYQSDTLAVGYHTLYVQEKDAASNWSLPGSARIYVGPK